MRRLVFVAACVALVVVAACTRGPVITPAEVRAIRTTAAPPTADPDSPLWDAAPEHPAKLMVQDVTEPRLAKPGVELINVRALHDGATIVFRLEWVDPTKDLIPDVGRSSDAVAVQWPLQPGADVPDAAMGQLGKGVQISYWKAVWQDDAERAATGRDRIAALHPNAAIDHYPAQAAGEAREEMERRYAPAVAAGNPIVTARNGAVQEIVAEGFGSSTAAPRQQATGRGVWTNGRWRTAIARPLMEGPGAANLQPGQTTYVAFAVWDGAERQTGARKMRSGWIRLLLE